MDKVLRMHDAIAIADVGRDGETRYPGEIDSAPAAVTGNEEVGKQVCEGTDLLRGWTHWCSHIEN